jgi:hypothetical protein
MKREKVWRVILFVTVTLSLAMSIAYAQKRKGQMQGMPRYDTTTEVTWRGTVTKVETHTGRRGWNGTHLVVAFDAETLPVHVGPSKYLEQQGFSFTAGEQIEVTGSRIKFEGSDVLIAREIKKGEKVLMLRNSQGIPTWAGNRSRW